MTVRMGETSITLEGDCPVGDAETLLGLLQVHPAGPVDLSGSGMIHGALIQLLIAVRPALIGRPSDPFVDKWILPHERM